jgi:hypothetical protein
MNGPVVTRPPEAASALPRGPQPDSQAESESECTDLKVLYNNSCVFVLDRESTFDFQVTPQVVGVTDLTIEITKDDQLLKSKCPMAVLRRNVCADISLNYTPSDKAGKPCFDIYVEYRQNGVGKRYVTSSKHTIYRPNEDARAIFDKFVFEVKNNIQQGPAGDIKVDQHFQDVRELLRSNDPFDLDKKVLDLISARPLWTPLVLRKVGRERRPLPPPNLALKTLDLEIRLFFSDLRIGKADDCELVARVLKSDGRVHRDASLRISGFHARLEWRGNRPVLADGGFHPGEGDCRASLNGTWVDGDKVPSKGDFALSPGREHLATLAGSGREGASGPGPFALRLRAWTLEELFKELPRQHAASFSAEERNGIACIVAQAQKGRFYVVLRRALYMGWLDPRCDGAWISRKDNDLHILRPVGSERLAADRRFRVGQIEFQVAELPSQRAERQGADGE